MHIIINWIVFSLAIGASAYLLPGVTVESAGVAIIAALIIGLINAFVKPLLVLLTLPINILTLGLFTFIINGLLIILAASIVDGFSVENFWWALLFSFIVSFIASAISKIVK